MSGRKCCDDGGRAKGRLQGLECPRAPAMSRHTQIKEVMLVKKRRARRLIVARQQQKKKTKKKKQRANDGNVPFLYIYIGGVIVSSTFSSVLIHSSLR